MDRMQSLFQCSVVVELPMTPSQPTAIVFDLARQRSPTALFRASVLPLEMATFRLLCFICKKATQSSKYFVGSILANAHIQAGFLYLMLIL